MDWLVIGGAGVLAVMFAISVWGKLDDWEQWIAAVERWSLPRSATTVVAIALPFAEMSAVVLLLWTTPIGLMYSGILLVGLAFGGFFVHRRSGETDCACFGSVGSTKLTHRLILRDVTLGLASGVTGAVAVSAGARVASPAAGLLVVLVASAVSVVLFEYSRLLATARTRRSRRLA